MTCNTAPAMHLTIVGSGPPVVLTHGFADDSSTFDAQLAPLAGHRVCRWDLPGHGRSSVGSALATRASALEWLDVAIDAVGGTPVTLVGHSLGGYLSLCRAVLDPTGIAGLVLIATGPGFRDPTKRDAWNGYLESYADGHGIEPAVRGIAEQPDSLVLDGLAGITAPVLVVVGGRDGTYRAGSRIIAEAVPSGRLVVVEGAGHFPHRTHAAEVNRAIVEHLDLSGSP
ncbi:alpha/beta fold hydrolase [Actinomarinicola tropica]|uniref:alpha/beta fold hydrolase n=1 Tax=Actinomarinicola tropica TaxID=2789776 RepID=UPI00189C03A4|nr:alpha/beta fold hydrolase [Actinomarinicola tropica]